MAGAGLRTWTTLEDRFSSRANSIGFLRHALAVFVLVGHTWPLGFGLPSLGSPAWHKQTDLGTMSVYGFFVLSGFLITASGLKFGIGRFGWHRFLRIFPGFWVCLVVTAIAIGPIAALLEGRSLHDYFTHPWGPLRYVAVNWSTSMDQFPISGLLTTTPSAGGKPGAFDGSLWSLKYELLCYLLIGILAVTAIIKRVRVAVVGLALAAHAGLVWYVVAHGEWLMQTPHLGAYGPYPVIGTFSRGRLLVLGTLFLIGATAKLYGHRLPLHPLLGAVATAALAWGALAGRIPRRRAAGLRLPPAVRHGGTASIAAPDRTATRLLIRHLHLRLSRPAAHRAGRRGAPGHRRFHRRLGARHAGSRRAVVASDRASGYGPEGLGVGGLGVEGLFAVAPFLSSPAPSRNGRGSRRRADP